MTQILMHAAIETVKAKVQAVAVDGADAGTGKWNKAVSMGPRLGRSSLKQASFEWSTANKDAELRNFKLQVNNIFQISDTNNAWINIKNWPGKQDKNS